MADQGQLNKQHLKLYLKVLYNTNNRRAKTPYNSKTENSNRIVLQMLGSVVMGVPLVFFITRFNNFTFALEMTFLSIISLLVLSFITEYSNLLFDTKDNDILFHRPISDRTVFAGRVIYILLFAFLMGSAMSLIPMIYLLVVDGGMMLLGYIVALVFTIFFSVFISLFLYMVLIKYLGGEKFNKFLYAFQILISAGLILFINIDRDFFQSVDFDSVATNLSHWAFAIPPVWEYGIVDFIANGNNSYSNLLLVLLAVVVPAVLGWFSYKYLAKSFKHEILKSDVKVGRKSSGFKISLAAFYAKMCTFNVVERNLFKTIYKILCRDKDFMMKVSSSAATMIILAGLNAYRIFVKSNETDGAPSDVMLLVIIYMLSVMYINAAQRFSIGKFKDVSDKYKASPMAKPGVISIAVIKALSCMFLVPIYMVASVFIVFVWGWEAVVNLIAVFFVVNIVANFTVFSGKSRFPLSLNNGDDGSTLTVMFGLFLLLVAAALHFIAMVIPYGVWGYTLIVAGASMLMMSRLKKKKWRDFM